MLIINNVEVRYGTQVALSIKEQVKFFEGDRIGIIGSNGAGKSTLVKTILGLTDYEGSIISDCKPENIGVHMQSNHYASTMAVRHIMETILNTSIKKNTKLQELIRFFDFEGCLNKKFQNLSGGQKQRLTIIMVLIQDSPMVFFDEVTSGLDFETRQKLMDKMVKWYMNKKTTLFIVSHYYEELEQLVDKILILEAGQIVDYGPKNELFTKYCGRTVITIDNTLHNEKLTKDMPRIAAPNHLIALACSEVAVEKELTDLLIRENINYKRSNNDIEIMSINAKKYFFDQLKLNENNTQTKGDQKNEKTA